MTTYEIVCGATGQPLRLPLVDSNGVAIVPKNGSVLLQGSSPDLPGAVINASGFIDTGTNEAVWYEAGGLVSGLDLGKKKRARFVCRLKYWDVDGSILGREVLVQFVRLSDALIDLEGAGSVLNTNKLTRYYAFENGAPPVLRNTFASPSVVAYPPMLRVATAGAGPENNKIWEATIERCHDLGAPQTVLPGTTILNYDVVTGMFCQMSGKSADRAKSPSAFVAIECASPGNATLTSLNANSGSVQLRMSLNDYSKWSLVRFRGVNDVANSVQVDFTVPLVNVNGVGGAPDPDFEEGHQVGLVIDPWELNVKAWVDGMVRATVPIDGSNLPVFFAVDPLSWGVVLYGGAQSLAVQIEGQWSAIRIESPNVSTIGSGLV